LSTWTFISGGFILEEAEKWEILSEGSCLLFRMNFVRFPITPFYTTRPGASRSVPVYTLVIAGTHCAYPLRDGQAELLTKCHPLSVFS